MPHFSSGLESNLGILGKGFIDDLFTDLRDFGIVLSYRGMLHLGNLVKKAAQIITVEWCLPGQQLKKEDTERENIRTLIDLLPHDLLG